MTGNNAYYAYGTSGTDTGRPVWSEDNRMHTSCIRNSVNGCDVLCQDIPGIPSTIQALARMSPYHAFQIMVAQMKEDHYSGVEDEVFFYHSDHLGSASWITNAHGDAVQHLQYLPFGEPFVDQRTTGYSERFRFTGKEKDEETGYGYFGARYMDHEQMTMWLSVDPMADKYPSISPYNYCMWNPVKLIDPDGRDVLPCSDEAYEMILRSIPIEARAYVKRNSDGYIDRDLINSYSCESQNFNDLKELVNMDDCTIEVMLANNYEWVDKDGNIQNWDMPYSNPELDAEFLKSLSGPIPDVGQFESPYKLSTGEYGDAGVALRPTSNSGKRSTNGNIQVYINEKLSVIGQVENFAHEFFGHAYLYAKTRSTTLSEHDYDTEPGTDSNTLLKNRIKRAQNEAASYNR